MTKYSNEFIIVTHGALIIKITRYTMKTIFWIFWKFIMNFEKLEIWDLQPFIFGKMAQCGPPASLGLRSFKPRSHFSGKKLDFIMYEKSWQSWEDIKSQQKTYRENFHKCILKWISGVMIVLHKSVFFADFTPFLKINLHSF